MGLVFIIPMAQLESSDPRAETTRFARRQYQTAVQEEDSEALHRRQGLYKAQSAEGEVGYSHCPARVFTRAASVLLL